MNMYVVRARATAHERSEFDNEIKLNLRLGIATVHWRVKLDLKSVHDPMDIVRYFQENIPDDYQKTEKGWLKISRELLLFANNIKEGDLIFTPDTPRNQIWVGRVVKPYKFDPILLDDNKRNIYHILEEVKWHTESLSRDDMPETICSPGHGKKGLDLRGTVYLIKDEDCRSDLLKIMRERDIFKELNLRNNL